MQNEDGQDLNGVSQRSRLSQSGRRKKYTESQMSEDRQWMDSPVDANDITVQVTPQVRDLSKPNQITKRFI